MDTTLMTFHLQTSTYTHSLHLIGSWDNFTKRYSMERDVRRSNSQWRGCYKFEDIVCDGDGETSPKRTGGLKMGSTYYYYYELDDGTETYDPSLPFTTACPYLPGQPLNLLSVPVEVQPPRTRSASMNSLAHDDIMTMNPADKFMSPRAPPPLPSALPRLQTAPSTLLRKRVARSVSPSSPRSPWSPKAFFGLRQHQDSSRRGRSSSVKTLASSTTVVPIYDGRSVNERKSHSVPHTRNASPHSVKRNLSRDPSPLRQVTTQEISNYNSTVLGIPDEIEEDEEDDDNFASEVNRMSSLTQSILTPLAPPPGSLPYYPSSARPTTSKDHSKPLPLLPGQLGVNLHPQPLRLRNQTLSGNLFDPAAVTGSRFSMSTISTTRTSPTDSHFSFSDSPSLLEPSEDLDSSVDLGSGDESTYSPVADEDNPFNGYSLPGSEHSSRQTASKEGTISPLTQASSRATFGGAAAFSPSALVHDANISALQDLLKDLGYLGEAIIGK